MGTPELVGLDVLLFLSKLLCFLCRFSDLCRLLSCSGVAGGAGVFVIGFVRFWSVGGAVDVSLVAVISLAADSFVATSFLHFILVIFIGWRLGFVH